MSVLGKSEIEKLLSDGAIFVPDSWEPRCIRSAGYDLRIAAEYLKAPAGTRYWPGGAEGRQKYRQQLTLDPGEVAFVSSVERICLPLNLAGNVAPKFELARRGFLIMGGLLVDPGYGLEIQPDGSWAATGSGERLHFQLANIGAERLTILPEKDKIAGIQFLYLDGKAVGKDERERDIHIPRSTELLESVFDRGDDYPLAPLAFFSRTRRLEGKVEALEEESDEHEIKLESTKRSTDQLVVFGMFLLAITLFSVATAALIEALASGDGTKAAKAVEKAHSSGGLSHDGTVAALILVVVVALFCLAAIANGVFLLKGRKAASKKKKASSP